MSRIYKLFIFLLLASITSCASDYSNFNAANDEDKDIGLGGTGLLATTGSGLGGTGIIGEITGFGSIFVNGIEIEYDDKTPVTIDGKKAAHQQLQIGDVVEVLTTNSSNHTHAQIINLRHEVIGKVESVNEKTLSYTVQGQTILQKKNTETLPKIGTTVAVAGIRINEKTIMSTRTTATNTEQTLLRLQTELPFKEQATRWSLQMHIKNGSVAMTADGEIQTLATNKKVTKSSKDLSTIKIVQLHKTVAGQIKVDKIISLSDVPHGQALPTHEKTYNNMQKSRRSQPRATRSYR